MTVTSTSALYVAVPTETAGADPDQESEAARSMPATSTPGYRTVVNSYRVLASAFAQKQLQMVTKVVDGKEVTTIKPHSRCPAEIRPTLLDPEMLENTLEDLEGDFQCNPLAPHYVIAAIPAAVLTEFLGQNKRVLISNPNRLPQVAGSDAGNAPTGDINIASLDWEDELVLVDSGAGLHIEKNPRHIEGFVSIGKPTVTLRTANGSKMHIENMGHAPGLGWIAYCSSAAQSLVSVPQLAKHKNVVTFNEHQVIVKNLTTGVTIYGKKLSQERYCILRSDLNRLSEEVLTIMALRTSGPIPAMVSNSTTVVELPTASNTNMSPLSTANPGRVNSDTWMETEATSTQDQVMHLSRRTDLSPEEVKSATQLRYLHTCIGHPSDDILSHQLENGLILGTTLNRRDVANASRLLGPCLICQAGKTRQRSRYLDEHKVPPAAIGEKVYVDLHPLQGKSIGGITQLLIAYDKYSGMLHGVKLINKTTKQLAKGFQTLFSYYSKNHHEIKEIHSDSEPNLVALQEWMYARTIIIHYSPPGEHNRPLERHINTLGQRVLCLQAQSVVELPPQLEAVSWLTAIGYINDTCTKRWPLTTPRFLFEGKQIDLSGKKLLAYGAIGSVRNFGGAADLSKRKIAIILGPSNRSYNSTKVYVSKGNKILTKSDKDIDILEVLPDKLPWKHKLGSTMYSIPRKVQRKRKRRSNLLANRTKKKPHANY